MGDSERFLPLWDSGPLYAPAEGLGVSTDSVLLADFAGDKSVARCLDIGCGGGLIALLLAWRFPRLTAEGVELLPEAASLCNENFAVNGLSERCRAVCADVRDYRALPLAGSYDLIVCNPPYFPENGAVSFRNGARAAARSEGGLSLGELCACAAALCRNGGRFCLVHRPERLSELFCALTAAGLEPKRLRTVCHSPGKAPALVLAEAIRGARPGLSVLPELLLKNADGTDSDEARRIYRL